MPALANHKHELFAQGLAKGENATAAYRNAGYSAVGNSAEASASRLLSDVKVQARIAELQERFAIRVEMTVLDIVRQLSEDREFARECESPSAMVSATLGMAKVCGLLKDKVELTGKDGGPVEHRDAAQAEVADIFGATQHEARVH